jgi:voltage-gated potassium channel
MLKKHLTTKEFLWIALVFWAACFTAMEAPFSFAFKTKIQNWQIISDAIISLFFIGDFVYHLQDRKNFKKEHVSDKFSFSEKIMMTVDILACIPFDVISLFFGHTEIFSILRLFRLIRIIKIFYLIENITIVPTLFRIQAISIFFFTVVNWIACGWILIYPIEPGGDIVTYYIRSFYWALTTLTTIGYGDITPNNNIGMIYTCFIMIIGVGMYGVVIGNITRMMALADRHKEQSREKMSDLLMFMKHYKIPENLQQSAINHYNHLFSKRLSENDEKIIADLPHALQNEMQIYMKIKLISGIPIFAHCPHQCLKEVAVCLEQIYSSPNEKIISIGEIGNEMFILAHGSVDIILESGERVASLHDGQIFGEIALLNETKRTANVQSNVYCDLYKLTSVNFKNIIKKYPILLENIEKATLRRNSDKK